MTGVMDEGCRVWEGVGVYIDESAVSSAAGRAREGRPVCGAQFVNVCLTSISGLCVSHSLTGEADPNFAKKTLKLVQEETMFALFGEQSGSTAK